MGVGQSLFEVDDQANSAAWTLHLIRIHFKLGSDQIWEEIVKLESYSTPTLELPKIRIGD